MEAQFEWDLANLSHLARHRISRRDAEEAILNDCVIAEYDAADGEDRWKAVGATSGLRVLVLIFTIRKEKIRVLTGWDADKRTKKAYFEQKGL